jgi:hypothetical protein
VIDYHQKHKYIGEWHEDEPHGITNIEGSVSFSFWGQYRYGIREGFWTEKFSDGTVNYSMYKDGYRNGYGIETNDDGEVYRGMFTDYDHDGYGLMKYKNNDEYDGQWECGTRHGEGVFKEASTGRVERRLYEYDKVKEVLEVIEQGH